MSAPDSVPEELRELRPPFQPASSAPLPRADDAHYDELLGLRARAVAGPAAPDTPLAPAWARFFQAMGPHDGAQLDQRAKRLARQLRENGVSYNVYTDDVRLQRPWALDLFPVLITPEDWAHIEAGVLQRVRVLETVMADAYGERRLLREGLVPPALVQGHPDYLRALHGVAPVGGQHLHIVAMDLARGPNGHWWVVSQRTQAPSGLGYLLENRLAVSSQFPEAFDALHVRRLAAPYRDFIEGVKARSPAGPDAHVALLTAGPYNETYFEQSYLARYLGVTLVEGTDLTVRGERLFLKTLHGLRPVDALIKRVDDAWVDPLEMRPDSRLGVPGLVQAVRAGNVLMANALGSGFLESSALLGFLPALARRLLDEELKLPALHTWWCGEAAAMQEVLPRLGQSVIKPTYPWSLSRGTFEAGVGPLMGPAQLAEWADRIRHLPDEHTVQAFLPTSQTPVWRMDGEASHMAMRSSILRVFALSDGMGGWQVLPGGMARLVGNDAGIATMQRGGSSADAWVLDDFAPGEVGDHSTLAPVLAALPTVSQLQRERLVTSRAAENLFWLGRYTERAENAARLARITLEALHGEEEPSYAMLMWLGQLTESAGLMAEGEPGPLQWRTEFERALIAHLGDVDTVPSVGFSLAWLRSAGAALRERLSTEHWNFIKAAQEQFRQDCEALNRFDPPSASDALAALARLSQHLAAITGAQNDRMWRDDGWRLMSAGRQLERLSFLTDALSRGFYTNAVHDAAGFGVVLDLFDSAISFHARYQRSREIPALLEHVVLNYQNPRSLAWVVQTLAGRLAYLHAREPEGVEDLSLRLRRPDIAELDHLSEADAIGDFTHLQALLTELGDGAATLSDAVALRYFSHTDDARRSLGAYMRLRVTHDTRYDYRPDVSTALHLVHLAPPGTARQSVLDHRLDVSPLPAVRHDTTDVYGNRRSFVELDRPHDALLVRARSLLDTQAPPPADSSVPWSQVRDAFVYHAGQAYHPASEFVFPSVYVHPSDTFAAYGQACFEPGRPLIDAARALMLRIHGEFAYRADVTEVNTPAAVALERREGVCQDFAHVMLACLRSLGLAARYVSGYLLTQPPPGMPRLIGSDASHAWVSVYLPDLGGARSQGGWYDLDPTNARDGWEAPGEDYVRLAVGRDFADVSPLRGVIHGAGRHRLHVGVTVEPCEDEALSDDGALA